MKITDLTAQKKYQNRVNVMVDGVYWFSLDIFQVSELGLRVGKEYTEAELQKLEEESVFGKLYARTLEYTMLRPHSAKEIRDYLLKKTRDTRQKDGSVLKGVPRVVTERVFDRLSEKGYVDDEKFARFWVENRGQRKGTSLRKLQAELAAKGVSRSTTEAALAGSGRSDDEELKKVIAKNKRRYGDEQKFMAYLARQGFSYDAIKHALSDTEDAD